MKYVIDITYFFISYLVTPRPTLGHRQRKGHQDACNEVGFS